MIASTHLAAGAAAGLAVQRCLSSDASDPKRLLLAFSAGFVSHLVLDAFPHQEYNVAGAKLGLVLFVEITTILAILLSPSHSLPANAIIFFGMAGGAIPDAVDLTYEYVVSWLWLGNLGSALHFFHGAIPTGFEANFYLQSLITLIAVILVNFKSA